MGTHQQVCRLVGADIRREHDHRLFLDDAAADHGVDWPHSHFRGSRYRIRAKNLDLTGLSVHRRLSVNLTL